MEGTWLGPAGPTERVVPALAQSDLWGPGGQGTKSRPLVGDPPEGGLAVALAGPSTGGSEPGPGVALQQSAHVQECLLQVVRQAGGVGFGTAVVG